MREVPGLAPGACMREVPGLAPGACMRGLHGAPSRTARFLTHGTGIRSRPKSATAGRGSSSWQITRQTLGGAGLPVVSGHRYDFGSPPEAAVGCRKAPCLGTALVPRVGLARFAPGSNPGATFPEARSGRFCRAKHHRLFGMEPPATVCGARPAGRSDRRHFFYCGVRADRRVGRPRGTRRRPHPRWPVHSPPGGRD